MKVDLCEAKEAIADDDRHDTALRSSVALFTHLIAFIFLVHTYCMVTTTLSNENDDAFHFQPQSKNLRYSGL